MIAHSLQLVSLDQDAVPVHLLAPGGLLQLLKGTALGELTVIDCRATIIGEVKMLTITKKQWGIP